MTDSEREFLTLRDAESNRALAAARAASGELDPPPVRGGRWERLHDEELAPTWLGWMECDS